MSDNETITGEVVKEVDVSSQEHPHCSCVQLLPRDLRHTFKESGTYKLVRVDE